MLRADAALKPHAGGEVHVASAGDPGHGKVLDRTQVADTVDDGLGKTGHGQTGEGAGDTAQSAEGQRRYAKIQYRTSESQHLVTGMTPDGTHVLLLVHSRVVGVERVLGQAEGRAVVADHP